MRPDTHMYRSALASRKTASRNRFAPLAGILAVLALAVLVACGDSGTGPDTQVASVSVSPATRALVVGDIAELAATVKNRAGDPLEGRDVEWSSTNPTVAEVSQGGVVEALKAGVAAIVATSEGKRGTSRVTVADATPPPPAAVARVEVEPAELVLPKYETRTLAARAYDADGNALEDRKVTWRSLNTEVATVDGAGHVTGRTPGWTRVVAEVEGRSAVADLTVSPAPVARIALAPVAPEMDQGEIVQLAARLEDAHGVELHDRAIDWTSSAPHVLRVEGGGQLFALASGIATITATSEGKSASVALRVVAPPAFDLIFDAPTPAGGAEIFLLELGSQTAPVRLNAGNVSRDPSPSPDGDRYVFAVSQHDPTTGAQQHDLYVVNVNGLAIRRLTAMPGVEQEPAWSPDGTRIAFSATDETGTDIWVVNADGTGLVNLTGGMGPLSTEHSPAWSFDGTRIAFATRVAGITSAVWTMRADGSDRAALVTGLSHGMSPTWSPDDTRIAFHYYSGMATGMDIAIVPSTGGTATTLALAGDQTTPAWSPDGALLAVTVVTAHGSPELWTMRPDGTGARRRGDFAGRNPSWLRR